MNSYSHSHPFNVSSPSISYTNSTFNTPPTSYCTCCSLPSAFYQQQMPLLPSQAYMYSPPPSPFYSLNNQAYIPTVTTQQIQQQPSSTRVTRLQYSYKDRYILNELFKRTPYPNAIQCDLIARQLGITREQIRIWFQNRRRLQTQRDSGDRLITANELTALQQGKAKIDPNELKTLLNEIAKFKNAPPRVRLDESS